MDKDIHGTEAGEIIAEMRKLHGAAVIDIPGVKVGLPRNFPLMLRPGPDGIIAESLRAFADEWRVRPERMVGTTRLDTAASLVDHANRFRNPQSVLFCNAGGVEAPNIICVYNYDDAVRLADASQPDTAAANWGDHRALWSMPLSQEWKIWSTVNGAQLDAPTFAGFLEDNILDVMPFDPTAAAEPIVQALGGKLAGADTVMALSRGVAIFSNTETQTKLDLSSGEATLVAREDHHDGKGAPVKIPNLLRINIPVFEQGVPVPIFVRLRYRTQSGGKIAWSFLMHDACKVLDTAVRDAAAAVAKETGLLLFYGAPA